MSDKSYEELVNDLKLVPATRDEAFCALLMLSRILVDWVERGHMRIEDADACYLQKVKEYQESYKEEEETSLPPSL